MLVFGVSVTNTTRQQNVSCVCGSLCRQPVVCAVPSSVLNSNSFAVRVLVSVLVCVCSGASAGSESVSG